MSELARCKPQWLGFVCATALGAVGCSSSSVNENKGGTGGAAASSSGATGGATGGSGGSIGGSGGSMAGSGGSAAGAGGSAGDASTNGGSGGTGVAVPVCGTAASADWLLCEDFESGIGTWSITVPGTAIADTSTSYAGTKGLRAEVTVPDSVAAIHKPFTTSAITTGTVYLRMYVKVSVSVTTNKYVTFARLWEASSPHGDDRISVYDGKLVVSARPTNPSKDDAFSIPNANVVTPDVWQCVTFRVDVADQGGKLAGSFGTQTVGLDDVDTLPAGGLERIELGIPFAGGPAEVYIDELAIDDQPLACP